MSRFRRCLVGASLAVFMSFAMTSSADALTLGNTVQPALSTPVSCGGSLAAGHYEVFFQAGTDSSYDYAVPAGGGVITAWSFNTAGAVAGTPYELVVVRQGTSGNTVVAVDNEVVPLSAPAVQTYQLSTPIQVDAGDVIGVAVSSTSNADCSWGGGAEAFADSVANYGTTTPPAPGPVTGPLGASGPSIVNVSANLVTSEDVSVTQTALSGSVAVGGIDAFQLSVTSAGPANVPVTLTDSVPSGLTVDAVNAGGGACTVSGQNVSCTLAGAPATVTVIVTGSTVGRYTNTATVSTALGDPNSANNTSSAALAVTGATVQVERLFSLKRLPLAEAKAVIRALGCRVGRITRKTSTSIRKGEVISTSPRPGTQVTQGTKIAIVVSSGAPKKKKARRA